MSRSIFIVIISFVCIFSACKKNDSFTVEPISDYYPLVVGKYITYDLDSLVFTNFGTELDTFHYQVKYSVDAAAVDNLNRSGYSVIRYIRFDSTFDWTPDHTDFVLNTGHSLEFTEDNMKYIKLSEPFQEGFSWLGNAYIATDQSDLAYLDNWNYTYDSLNTPITLGALTVDSTITVIEENDSTNFPIDPTATSVAIKKYSVEKYAKHIGLVYRNFFYQEYQERTAFTDAGYGIILTMIDHN
jgi:hypothetical protein